MPKPLIIDREHDLGAIVYHSTGYGPGTVIGYQTTTGETTYLVRWGGAESEALTDDTHAPHELTTEKLFPS